MARTKPTRFRYFNSSPEVIRLTVMMYVRYPMTPSPPPKSPASNPYFITASRSTRSADP
jgi:hypothetical protein